MFIFTLALVVTTWIQISLGLLTCSNLMRLKIPTLKICYSAMIISFINVIPIYFSDLQSAFVFLFSLSATFLLCITSYKLSVSKSIVFCMLDLLFSAIIECSMIIFDIFVISRQGFFFSNIRENSLLIILRAVSLVPCLIIYKISQFAMKNETNEHNITINTYLIIVFNMAFLILFIYPNIVYFEHFELNLNQYILGYNVFIILLFIIYGIVNAFQAYQMGKQAFISENQKIYTQTLENSLDQIKGFRHEMNNIISTIAGFVELERLDLLRPYIGDLQQRLTAQSSTNVLNLNLREVPILYGLLIGKVNYATNMGVRFEIAIVTKEEIVFPNEVLYDLAYIMGVWLDNAIEAAAASELRQVNLLVRDDSDCYNIVVRNSFEGEVDLKKIKRKNYSTKSNHMGIGLHQVEEKVQAQSKYFSSSTTINECSFIQHLQVKK
ncbi:sensory histidine kinase DcuS [uncultured Anaerotruncus sp.]|uniref:Sensory histidine kinase DcuS n=2 Tax=Oscillospiraceae TaxID=216572 RepID=A0A6N2S4F6_9FIRM